MAPVAAAPARDASPPVPVGAEAQPAAPPRRLRGTAFTDAAIQVGLVAALALAWQLGATFGAINPFLLPPLSDVAVRIWEDALAGTVFVDLALTLYRALTGFLIAAALGIPIGILMSRSAIVRWFFDPLISIGFPMPKVAFLPIFILWFDIYDTSKIIMVTFSCFFPIVAATYAGTTAPDKWPIWSARSFGAKEHQILWEVSLPMALPQIMTGLQVALPVGLITTIVTEMLMGGRGIGGAMIAAGRFADSVGVFAGIVEIVLLGFLAVRSLELVRARLLRWHPEARR